MPTVSINPIATAAATVASCSCPLAGVCERHGSFKTEKLWNLCQTSPITRVRWDIRAGLLSPEELAAAAESATPPPAAGVGTELKLALDWWGYKSNSTCRCAARVADMNSKGIEWCEHPENFETIIGWLRDGAVELGVVFIELGARIALRNAISSAKKKAAAVKTAPP